MKSDVPVLKLIVLVVAPVKVNTPPLRVSVVNVGLGDIPTVTTGPAVAVMLPEPMTDVITPGALATKP
jgi:hypothetical protein